MRLYTYIKLHVYVILCVLQRFLQVLYGSRIGIVQVLNKL